MPYHNFAWSKYVSLDMDNTLPGIVPCAKKLQIAREAMGKYGFAIED